MAQKSLEINQPSNLDFIITELFVFLSQVFVFFLVTVFTSDFLRNEERLAEFIKSKINSHTWGELGFTLLAITVALGVIAIIKEMASSKFVGNIAREVINELPRTIYVFGSSITAMMLAVAVFYYNQPPAASKQAQSFFVMAGLFAIATFTYGFGIKAALTLKARKALAEPPETRRKKSGRSS